MNGYIASAAARRLFVFLAAGAVIYAILSLAPGDPAQVILGKPAIYLYPQEETIRRHRACVGRRLARNRPTGRRFDRRDGPKLALSVLGGQLLRSI